MEVVEVPERCDHLSVRLQGREAPGESVLTLTWMGHIAAASSSRAITSHTVPPNHVGATSIPGTQFEEHLKSQDAQVFPVQGGCEESILRCKEEKALLFPVIEAEKKEKRRRREGKRGRSWRRNGGREEMEREEGGRRGRRCPWGCKVSDTTESAPIHSHFYPNL